MKYLGIALGVALISLARTAPASEVDKALQVVGSPSVDKPLSADSGLQIQASSTASNATVKESTKRSGTDEDFHTFSLIGQTPIGKGGSDNPSLASLDGLANGTTVELKYSEVHLQGSLTPGEALADECDEKYKPLFV